MIRGEVWWVEFGPARGGEIRKTRPAIIVSNDVANRFLNRVQVVPITSNVSRLYPSEAYVSLDGAQRKAIADQITTVAKVRLTRRMAHLSTADMEAVARVIRVHLYL